MRRLSDICLLALFSILAAACSEDDDYHYPSVLTELVELNVDADSLARTFTTDTGLTYSIAQGSVKANRPDTVIRCLCIFLPDAEDTPSSGDASSTAREATVYSLGEIFSQAARPCAEFTSFPHVPVQFISSWHSSRWLNLYVGVLTSSQTLHSYAFSQDSLVSDSSTGIRTAYISLLHNYIGDAADDYTQKTYLSLPLTPFEGLADSLVLSLYTHDGTRAISVSLP